MPKLARERIETFLNTQNLAMEEESSQKLVDFILNQALQQHRKKVSPRFILSTMALFLKKDVDVVRKGFTPTRLRREGVDYTSKSFPESSYRRGSLLQILARKVSQTSKYAVTEAKGISSPLVNRVRTHSTEEFLVRSPRQLTFEEKGVARGPNNTPYKPIMTGSSGMLWGEDRVFQKVEFETMLLPSKEELQIKHPELFSKPSEFEFTITKEVIESRLGTKRPCSQKQVTGYSAKEFFTELGAVIQEKTYGSFYHLAHRQGFGAGGDQSTDNLDAATEGSNYQLLFFIENPMAGLLLDNTSEVAIVNVKGKVIYHPELPLPQEIIYTVSWGNTRMVQKIIYPLDYERPTIHDNQVAKAFIRSQRSPVKPSAIGFFSSIMKEEALVTTPAITMEA